ncbi:putative sodium-dependent multivitamin transporter [Venturia canescens]|uniref:putative sodium-dependent multivitamin transporter n=1 Tax=Venturia canescens TaxID=32260 RepID=UPI001C9CB82C|nr:putative sodium-dependent multivitamin transporter [Venturia canescens]
MSAKEGMTGSLEWPDYMVIGIVLSISALIGVYYRFTGGRQKTSAEYFSANRSMSIPLLAIALMVAFISAIAMLGVSGESYISGIHFAFTTVGLMCATPIVAFFYLPVFYKLQYLSVYEYLETRFGKAARLTASVANYVHITLYTGVVLFAPALALEATTGLSSTASVFLIGVICTFYSSIGGIKAVLATDVFQGFLMFAAIFCVIGVGCSDFEGGAAEVWETAIRGGRVTFDIFDLDPTVRHTWFGLILGGMGIFIANFGVSQVHVQRLSSAKTLKEAQIAIFLNTPLIVAIVSATSFAGLVLYAWFESCDPKAAGQISSFDQVMPYFAKVRMSKISGLTGFFVAGIFSASLSTVSAMLNSLSAVAIADYIAPIYRLCGSELAESKGPLLGKLLAVVNGALCVGIALMASHFGNLIQMAFAISGATAGPVLGLFSLGIFFEYANERGAVAGTILTLCLTFWMAFGSPKPPVLKLPVSIDGCPNSTHADTIAYMEQVNATYKLAHEKEYFYLYRISYMWYTPIGFLCTIVLGFALSVLIRKLSKNTIVEPEPDLFTPIVAARMRRRREDLAKTTTSQVFVLSTKEIVPTQ